MRPVAVLGLAASLFCSMPVPAIAQATVGPNDFQCHFRHPITSHKVIALQIYEEGPYWATARVARKGGAMTIVYGSDFFRLPPLLQRLYQHHECGHFDIPTRDEYEANCYALRRLAGQGLLDAANLGAIRDHFCGLGELEKHPAETGAAYWEGTRNSCSDLALPRCPEP